MEQQKTKLQADVIEELLLAAEDLQTHVALVQESLELCGKASQFAQVHSLLRCCFRLSVDIDTQLQSLWCDHAQ